MDLVDHFVVDLCDRAPCVLEYDVETIVSDLNHYKTKNVMDLEDWTWRIFKKESDAERFLSEYEAARQRIKREFKGRKNKTAPCLLYPQVFMALALLGVKNETSRHYDKPQWKRGEMFYFHDQVHFIPCRLLSKTEYDGGFKYKYEVIA